MVLRGIIESGTGKGAFFTQVGWVLKQCRNKLGYEPFPGTLNVRVIDADLERLESFLDSQDFVLVPEDPAFCSAGVKEITVNGIPAAVILPAEDVRIHEKRVMEIIAACSLKKALGLDDGDRVTIAAAHGSYESRHPAPVYVMNHYKEIYEFASSAGALEGYVYPLEKRDMAYLDNWIQNLVLQYHSLPGETRESIQASLDRTLGRAVQSLELILGREHHHIRALRGILKGAIPASPHDFDLEKKEKASKYGE